MAECVPTLSASGWERGIKEKADRLMSYFIVSQYSQSQIFSGSIASLPYLIATHAEDSGRLKDVIDRTLIDLYGAYFDSVTADTTIAELPDSPAKQQIQIDVTVTENGIQYSLGRLLESTNSVISNIVELEKEMS